MRGPDTDVSPGSDTVVQHEAVVGETTEGHTNKAGEIMRISQDALGSFATINAVQLEPQKNVFVPTSIIVAGI